MGNKWFDRWTEGYEESLVPPPPTSNCKESKANGITPEDIREIACLTVKLVRISVEQKDGTNQGRDSIEDIGSNIFHSLLSNLLMVKNGHLRVDMDHEPNAGS